MFNSLEDAVKFADEQKNRANDGGVPVFFKKAVAFKDKHGNVDYRDEIWVKIFNKGDPKNIMERNKRPEDEKRWPEHWRAYLEDEEPDIDGIPLSDFPNITPAERMKCKALHIRSVEDLVNYPDAQINDLGGRGHLLKKKAKEFIEYKEGTLVKSLEERIKELEKLVESNSTGDNSKRRTRNKSAKSGKRDEGGSRPRGESVSDTRDDLPEDSEKKLAGSS